MHALLVDDHSMFRQGLKFLLRELDPDIVFLEAESTEAALVHAGKQVDLILLDLHLPGANGMDALSAMRAAFDLSPLVVLSGEDDPRAVRDAIDLGACGFVHKRTTGEVLIAALRLVLAGGVYLPPHVLRAYRVSEGVPAVVEAPGPAPVRRPEGLSDRQFEVLLKAIQGKANKVIARELNLSEGTIKAHLSAAFRALGVQNRTEAVFAAARAGRSQPDKPVTTTAL